ncbi:YafY family protein [Asticcacaulis sp. AC402]|uniref:helix-turn-helix transcriptional regulator n=1 Tax=Asticcacaulis sp. AC402 TaxID=1282361 RepID=UPI0003C3BBAA|nr:WYL domain-containing protein [Asticcacaulis sp. AC402]ESQ76168.1 hypothetical protein ABAC402_06875 [Asticcacaulis sp. AC402]
MRASRLLSILMLLQLRGRLTAEFLAAEFEVSMRTIYRDIDELSASGVPVYADRGPGGGFALMDGYRTRLTGMAAGEAEALFLVGMPGPAAALGMEAAAAMAGHKVLAALPGATGVIAGRTWLRFHLDPAGWYRGGEPPAALLSVARAVWDRKAIAMRYDSWAGTRDWHVEPLGLVLKAGDWYVVARGAGKVRIFKVASILGHEVLETGFDTPEAFDLAAFWTAEVARFEVGLRPDVARLRVSSVGAKRLERQGAYAVHSVAQAGSPDVEGWVTLDLPIENIEDAALIVLGLGAEAEALAPDALRDRVQTLTRDIAVLYSDRSTRL